MLTVLSEKSSPIHANRKIKKTPVGTDADLHRKKADRVLTFTLSAFFTVIFYFTLFTNEAAA